MSFKYVLKTDIKQDHTYIKIIGVLAMVGQLDDSVKIVFVTRSTPKVPCSVRHLN